MTIQVGYIVGGLATGSINKKLAGALADLAPEQLVMNEIRIDNLPLYNYDYDAQYPPEAVALKEQIAKSDAVLFVTPEYNRGMPGALKNAIDWASHPWGKNSFDGKPCAVIGASIFPVGTAVAQQHVRTSMAFLNASCMAQPEACIHAPSGYFSETGELTQAEVRVGLAEWMSAFKRHVERHLASN